MGQQVISCTVLRDSKEEGGDVSEAVDLPEWLCPVDLIAGTGFGTVEGLYGSLN